MGIMQICSYTFDVSKSISSKLIFQTQQMLGDFEAIHVDHVFNVANAQNAEFLSFSHSKCLKTTVIFIWLTFVYIQLAARSKFDNL